MTRARWWMFGALTASFAAGVNVGILVPKVMAAEAEPTAEAKYVGELADKYDLSSEQERRLQLVVLAGRNEEIAVLSSAEATQLPPLIQGRLLDSRRRTEQRIRAVLDDEQRARYDEDSRPTNRGPADGK